MQLSKFSDYAFRVLIFLAKNEGNLFTVSQMSDEMSISSNHLKKIVHKLSKNNLIHTFKGRDGGIRLAKAPYLLNLADVLNVTEANTHFVECLDLEKQSNCPYKENCNLQPIIHDAKEKFISEFRKYTLQDLLS